MQLVSSQSEGRTGTKRSRGMGDVLTRQWREFGLLGALLVMVVIFSVLAPNFLTSFNLINVVRQVSIVAVAAVGATAVILIAGIDLSVGSSVALTGTVAALYLSSFPSHGWGAALTAVAIAAAVGTLAGVVNGLVITVLKVPAFIATLAALTVLRGIALLLTNSFPVSIPPGSYHRIGLGHVGPVPTPVIIMACVFAVGYLLLQRFRIGRRIYAIGGNETAARLSGIDVRAVTIAVYAFAGFCAGVAGILVSSRLSSGQPAGSMGFELSVIAAVVVGGTSLMGGRGRLSGTFLGALMIGVLVNGLTLMNVSDYWQRIVTGLVIILAVVMDNVIRRRIS